MAIKNLDHVNFVTRDLQATIKFYCDIIGLVHGKNLSIDTAESAYFYIKNQSAPILHVLNASCDKQQPKFKRIADLSAEQNGKFSTGSFDHFCLQVDDHDYGQYIEKLDVNQITYQTYCHQDIPLKQIWILDPNGVRVELNFSS